jgi:hypothetical protein
MLRRRATMSEPEGERPSGTEVAAEAPGSPAEPLGAAGEAAPGATDPTSQSFWNAGQGIHALDDPMPLGQENALQKLGKPPFERTARGRFRLLGYLATVYEHVSQDVGSVLPRHSGAAPAAQEQE